LNPNDQSDANLSQPTSVVSEAGPVTSTSVGEAGGVGSAEPMARPEPLSTTGPAEPASMMSEPQSEAAVADPQVQEATGAASTSTPPMTLGGEEDTAGGVSQS
jgi:hypothetical protein